MFVFPRKNLIFAYCNRINIYINMNKQQLANKIWASANKMRSKIDANEYKDYILGLIFYKFLSDNEVNYILKDMKGTFWRKRWTG